MPSRFTTDHDSCNTIHTLQGCNGPDTGEYPDTDVSILTPLPFSCQSGGGRIRDEQDHPSIMPNMVMFGGPGVMRVVNPMQPARPTTLNTHNCLEQRVERDFRF